VAQLAGVPKAVITMAKVKLRQLEQQGQADAAVTLPMREEQGQQLSLLAVEHPLVAQLAALNPDEFSARQALELLYQLSRDAKES
jgi:DNA mismatch repair protein MutS